MDDMDDELQDVEEEESRGGRTLAYFEIKVIIGGLYD